MKRHVVIAFALAAAVAGLVAPRTHAQQADGISLLISPEQARGFVAAWNSHAGYMPGETLVKFREGMTPADATRALSALRRRTDGATTRWIGDLLLVSTPLNPDAEDVAAQLARQPEVEWAQPNYLRRLQGKPNDPDYSSQWNLDLMGMPAAWDINDGGNASVTVAVVDSGVTNFNGSITTPLWTGAGFENVTIPFRVNPDLSLGRMKNGRDFVFGGGNVFDADGHGTAVAATALEDTNNGIATAGIAYRASLMPLKACLGYWDIQLAQGVLGIPGFVDPADTGFCPDSATIPAIRYAADSGAHVVNLSFDGLDPDPGLRDAINYAVTRGTFVTIAGGNEFEQGNPVEYPSAYAADVNGAMAVGAVGRSSKRAYYSNTGSYIEIVAPGGDDRDGGFNGLLPQVTLLFPDSDPGRVIRPRFDRYAEFRTAGTSFSAPHVAGVAALLFAQGITKPAAIEAALRQFATDLGASGRDNEYGYGLVNARAALRGMGLLK